MEALERIIQSDSYASFRAEREIATKLHDLGWNSIHGFYFQDSATKKHREVDVAAEQFWKKTISKIEVRATALLLAEVKTMRGFHILLSPKKKADIPLIQRVLWSGDSAEKYVRVVDYISDLNLSTSEITALVNALNKYAYPQGFMRRGIASAQVRPFELTTFNAFRETNIGGEKDLDNSVFWRSSEALRSACDSITEQWEDEFLQSVKFNIEMSKRKTKNWLEDAIKWIKFDLNFVKLIHPFVVTEAQLWDANSNHPKELPFARFAMQDSSHSAKWWCDIVNIKHRDEYLEKLSNNYAKRMFKSRPQGFEQQV